jgi:hypothetical protein
MKRMGFDWSDSWVILECKLIVLKPNWYMNKYSAPDIYIPLQYEARKCHRQTNNSYHTIWNENTQLLYNFNFVIVLFLDSAEYVVLLLLFGTKLLNDLYLKLWSFI